MYASYGGLYHHASSSELGTLLDGALLGEQVSGVAGAQAGLDLEHGGHGPAEASATLHACVASGSSLGGAGLVLQQLDESVHIRPQSGHQAGAHCCHGVLIALHQALQESTVIPVKHRQNTQISSGGTLLTFPILLSIRSIPEVKKLQPAFHMT